MKENILIDKAERFAIRVVNLYKFMSFEKHETVMSKQLLRCGTSIGANLAEAQCAQTRPDFTAKLYIAYKECSETKYWLRILRRTEYLSENEYSSINNDCMELLKMLSKITKTIKESSNSYNGASTEPNSTANC